MAWSNVEPSDATSWLYEVENGAHYDAPQAAKKHVADNNDDVDYRHLSARVVNQRGLGERYVAVVYTGLGDVDV